MCDTANLLNTNKKWTKPNICFIEAGIVGSLQTTLGPIEPSVTATCLYYESVRKERLLYIEIL